MIDLYTWGTPNGRKVSIMLEATALPYIVHPINIQAGDQFTPEFLAISPNNKIPAISDDEGPGGETVHLFESGAILLYLAEKTGNFLPTDPMKRLQCLQWLMWQMGGFGPMLGQAHHFNRFAKEKIPYAISRYTEESRRLWGVLDRQLEGQAFIVDLDLSIADFAIYPWACRFEWQEIELDDFPNVKGWMERMSNIAFVQRGMAVP
ncbi:glutathione S-transferase [Amphritea atlantica]|uniref:Glutathione S-transferase n=1 Tax=Amphritea atlantica TaxID=355243 RepID=A0A1H9DEE2_9GAMM|nr:glutathione S-transferase N-terminal domain-containing protein [Amphritea atlantica]SEQ11824.1 glutathione S-transferase [Amphritea atlantica]